MRDSYKGISINCAANTHAKAFSLLSDFRSGVIVDIPCGAGAMLQRLIDHGWENVVGMDVENHTDLDSHFIAGDMTKRFPFEDGSVDVFMSLDGIEHIDEQFFFIREINRCLKDDGELIISTPNISSLRSRWRWLLSGHHNKCKNPLDESEPNPSHHIAMISFPEIRYILHTSGFEIVKVATNRIKLANYIFAPLYPFVFVYTLLSYKRGAKRNRNLKQQFSEIFQAMLSPPVMFGEILILKVKKMKAI